MNMAITNGVELMPSAFEDGLGQWSSGDGTPGSDTYSGSTDAAFVPADQDFGGCLELLKVQATQKLRFMGETPILPGCYLRITARVKAMSGNLPSVRIAGWAGKSNGSHLGGVDETGPSVALSRYGEIVEVSAIVGTGARSGVDMAWGVDADYGHFGLDLTGDSGGVVRIDDIEIRDVTNEFIRELISIVDVRDYGAMGDGSTDDSDAFTAANSAAKGRTLLVPRGTYKLNKDVTIDVPVRFEGKVVMPASKMLLLTGSFDYATYAEAFKDEELAFRKAFQALLNNSDHESLDLCGRKITVTGPIDMQAAVPNKSSYATRRVIRNGQLVASSSSDWAIDSVTSYATYDPSDSKKLTAVSNVSNIQIGARVSGSGVGREIYVKSVNVGAGEVTLNAPLYDAAGRQNFTFRNFKYMLDFSGFSSLSKFVIADVELQCQGYSSGIRLAPGGSVFHLRDCFINRPKNRAVTSIGSGCQGMLIDRCQFLSDEDSKDVSDRTSIAINANSNDVKLRNCRATRFRHFALLAGGNSVVLGNHFFQGDGVTNGVRSAGLIIAANHTSATITGNYIDNCFIEWTNERDATPKFTSGYSFSAMNITDNIFLSGDVAPWFSYIVIKPHGSGHYLNGVNISGNRFRSINGNIDRVERVDTSFADLDYSRFKNVTFTGNSFHAVNQQAANPLRVEHSQNSTAVVWNIETDNRLPFGAQARHVESVVARGAIVDGNGSRNHDMPYADPGKGSAKDGVNLVWGKAVKGKVLITVRIDDD